MSNAAEQQLEFQCPKCRRKLKANRQVAGKRVKCPQCGQTVKVPGAESQAGASDDDWLSLDIPSEKNLPAAPVARTTAAPATGTSPPRQSSATSKNPTASSQNIAASKSSSPTQATAGQAKTQSTSSQGVKPDAASPQQKQRASKPQEGSAKKPLLSAPLDVGDASNDFSEDANSPRRSVFDDDLPVLAAINQAQANAQSDFPDLVSLDGFDDSQTESSSNQSDSQPEIGQLDDLGSIALVTPEIEAQAQYRIACKNCDTPQYVTVAQKGRTIQCPDCFIRFTIPGPPLNWKPTKAASLDDWGKGAEVRLAPVEATGAQQEAERERLKTTEILKKAQRELDDEIDEMVGTDFDTKGFIEKSLGFLKDPTTIMQLVLYGCLFALMFGAAQFSALRMIDGDYGYGFILVIAVPTLASLVCLPMLSGGMALLESVANGRRRVAEWPSFNLFENLSEILFIGAALGIAMLIGLIAGGLIGRVVGSNWMILVGILGTTFLLFPILLLSMLDNGSMFQPISTQVVRSMAGSAEAWGAYYLKTLFGFFCAQVAWFLLLGGHPIAAAVGGFLLPWLLFFTCQQLGVLALGIGEYLSFEFASENE